ncbi:MAG: hypothetical protein HC786_05450 [Richelia sp. CSU_2_1]|nr:hypothetical protein [Microcoleus sp. SU_5_6]NJR21649.1 hypothetical protein [Richelia sp. CSU_2_1]
MSGKGCWASDFNSQGRRKKEEGRRKSWQLTVDSKEEGRRKNSPTLPLPPSPISPSIER